MLTLAQAKLNKVYTIEEIQAEGFAKKHLNNLGLVPGGKVVLVNYSSENGIVLLHNSRIAINLSVLQQITIVEKNIDEENWLSLDQLTVGEKARVIGIHGQGAVKRRLMDMGLTKGVDLLVRKMAPLGDPIEINLRGYELTLRKNEAELVLVQKEG
ncbi:ferrous iron transporter A [Enterococcus haemoperoxidus ATCC BAA-382]|uniref:Ferrous iron transporter A n=1 Tax=Enterococcus haemoperoxidus ATCC BAA-382 TaxID=1158608 RepID=R2QXS4_9ENTE|nr:ferrous iron transport protein A [Enterococcus haemoperoxidus]EOI00191.1 ferrous iron transporter A [Enterococcus haemoperoxidus ATCC BAA-382]EOT59571.1 ferrous iron transporter A [Enterococcus haemoperoxidus ATCC BAA-382]OJG52409.1 ferrous iron transporter A [Enterococcus haemoperoxidus]